MTSISLCRCSPRHSAQREVVAPVLVVCVQNGHCPWPSSAAAIRGAPRPLSRPTAPGIDQEAHLVLFVLPQLRPAGPQYVLQSFLHHGLQCDRQIQRRSSVLPRLVTQPSRSQRNGKTRVRALVVAVQAQLKVHTVGTEPVQVGTSTSSGAPVSDAHFSSICIASGCRKGRHVWLPWRWRSG